MKPRPALPQGRLHVAGLLFVGERLSTPELRSRVLAQWRPGSELFEGEGSILLRFAAPVYLSSPFAALPLLLARGQLCALAAPDPEMLSGYREGSVIWMEAGAVRVWRPNPAERSSPARWLTHSLQEVAPVDLGRPPSVSDARPRGPKRSDFGVDEGDPETEAVLEEMLNGASGKASAGGAGASGTGGGLWERFEGMLADGLRNIGLGRLINERQAAFFSKLFSKLEQEDWEEALRTAIPLAGEASDPAAQQWLREPGRRFSLNPSLRPGVARSTTYMADRQYLRLRALYLEAAEKLEAKGEIERAAFVFTDLLGSPSRAVDLLLRHQRYVLAAKIVEGHELGAAQAVRIWFLAGNIQRAMQLAELHQVFGMCVSLLADGYPKQARQMRLVWAARLAEQGDLEGAVEAIWPVEDARDVARGWIELCVEQGGARAGRMLYRELTGIPGAGEDRLPLLRSLFEADHPEVEMRRVLYLSLAQEKLGSLSPKLRAVLYPMVLRRALLERVALRLRAWTLQRLAERAGPPWSSDMPRLPKSVPGVQSVLWREGGPARAVTDIVRGASGRVWTAHGAGGLVCSAPDGTQRMHLAEPGTFFVPSEAAGVALVLWPLDLGVFRVSRLDLWSGELVHWQDLCLEQWCDRLRGNTWFVALASEKVDGAHAVVALDVSNPDGPVVWKREPEGRVCLLELDEQEALSAVVDTGEELQTWRWRVDLERLLARVETQLPVDLRKVLGTVPIQIAQPGQLWLGLGRRGDVHWVLSDGDKVHWRRGSSPQVPAEGTLCGRPVADSAPLLPLRRARGAPAVLVRADQRETLLLCADHAEALVMRRQGQDLLVADDRGHMGCLELSKGRWTWQARRLL